MILEELYSDHLDELDLVADSLFAALRQFLRLDELRKQQDPFYGTAFGEEAWRQIPNNIRAVLLALIYASYTDRAEVPEELRQWRQDLYVELDEVATKPTHLRKVK